MSAAATPLPLRDIHLPAEPGWWPPAPGWWFLALCVLLTAIWFGRAALRSWRARRRRARLLREFEADVVRRDFQQPIERLRAAAEWLRRVVKRDAPAALALQGEPWLAFLDRDLDGRPFSTGPGRVLVEAMYAPSLPADQVDAAVRLIRRRLERGL